MKDKIKKKYASIRLEENEANEILNYIASNPSPKIRSLFDKIMKANFKETPPPKKEKKIKIDIFKDGIMTEEDIRLRRKKYNLYEIQKTE